MTQPHPHNKKLTASDASATPPFRPTQHRIDVVRYGDDAQSVGKIVVANAKNLGASMVVMSNHNKSALEEMFIGSTSQFVTHVRYLASTQRKCHPCRGRTYTRDECAVSSQLERPHQGAHESFILACNRHFVRRI